MGFLSSIKDLFGGTNDDALQAQERANERTQQFIEEQAKLARTDALNLYPESMKRVAQGFQGSIDVMRAALPEQLKAITEGYTRGQQTLASGSQQYQNAILGLPIDRSFMQPTAPTAPDLSFMNANLPEYGGNPGQALTGQAPPVPTTGGTGGGGTGGGGTGGGGTGSGGYTPVINVPNSSGRPDGTPPDVRAARLDYLESLTPEQLALTGRSRRDSLSPEQWALLNNLRQERSSAGIESGGRGGNRGNAWRP